MSTLQNSLAIKARGNKNAVKMGRENGSEHGPVSTGSGALRASILKKNQGQVASPGVEKINAYS